MCAGVGIQRVNETTGVGAAGTPCDVCNSLTKSLCGCTFFWESTHLVRTFKDRSKVVWANKKMGEAALEEFDMFPSSRIDRICSRFHVVGI